jgi:hypothetical protein
MERTDTLLGATLGSREILHDASKLPVGAQFMVARPLVGQEPLQFVTTGVVYKVVEKPRVPSQECINTLQVPVSITYDPAEEFPGQLEADGTDSDTPQKPITTRLDLVHGRYALLVDPVTMPAEKPPVAEDPHRIIYASQFTGMTFKPQN